VNAAWLVPQVCSYLLLLLLRLLPLLSWLRGQR
jgi:hypothetical protein